jgi:hypothetical protein
MTAYGEAVTDAPNISFEACLPQLASSCNLTTEHFTPFQKDMVSAHSPSYEEHNSLQSSYHNITTTAGPDVPKFLVVIK